MKLMQQGKRGEEEEQGVGTVELSNTDAPASGAGYKYSTRVTE